ncbi:ABC transporter ATP-binding protein [Paenibacillus psychroresistens]|uniref:ABC transporter ATP-binding protein n=1 Tax=Paenibacillus psychroresistens TaxID=1778678 RepID=A0A6B8RSQ7_9BACL|nr:ABC transporter ATP-binding protein [Paenibacillus psychroresistens]QGQ99481.1 ABC transporter ATP-binding protein [Paenibacillus psychroresistens]
MNNMQWVWSYIRNLKLSLFTAMFLVVVGSVISMFYPLLAGRLVDDVINKGHSELLLPLLGTMIGLMFLKSLIRYVYQMLCEKVSQQALFNLREELYKKLLSLDFDFFNNTRVGDIMARMTGDIEAFRHFLAFVVYNIVENMTLLLFAIYMMMQINVPITLILVVITFFIGIVTFRMSREVKPMFYEIRQSFSRLNSVVQENISGNRVVKAFAREDFEIEKFTIHNKDYNKRNMDSAKVWVKYLPIVDSLTSFLKVATLLVGGIFVMKGTFSLGDLIVFNGFLWMLDGPMRMSGWLINDVQRFVASSYKIREMLDAESKITNPPLQNAKKLQGYVRFDQVSFQFADSDQHVLKKVSFEAKPGQTVAILGATGSGKSTLVSLISRFYDASEGTLFIDHEDIRNLELRDLRSSISTVMQDIFLFSDTIEGNIAFSEPNATFSQVESIARIADAHNFIMKLNEGYDTIVGERGVGLSGGQKQRISLARALLRNASILILDDTTSAVDMETEFKIQQELKKIGSDMTIFVIAHRISSVMDADLILIMEHGEVIERGTHEELMKQEGYYYNVFREQLGDFNQQKAVS